MCFTKLEWKHFFCIIRVVWSTTLPLLEDEDVVGWWRCWLIEGPISFYWVSYLLETFNFKIVCFFFCFCFLFYISRILKLCTYFVMKRSFCHLVTPRKRICHPARWKRKSFHFKNFVYWPRNVNFSSDLICPWGSFSWSRASSSAWMVTFLSQWFPVLFSLMAPELLLSYQFLSSLSFLCTWNSLSHN